MSGTTKSKRLTMEKKRKRVQKSFNEVGRTKPEFADSCNINKMLKRYRKTGVIRVAINEPVYGDFTGPSDLTDALEVISNAKSSFESIPAAVRKRFNNDMYQFMGFMEKASKEELLELGLAKAEPKVLDPKPEVLETKPEEEKKADEVG